MTRVVIRRPREVSIETFVSNVARGTLGVENVKLGHRASGGYPDRLFFVPGGRPKLIEFKRPGEVPDERQKEIHRRLRAAGYDVEVHDNRDAAVLSLRRAVDAQRRSKKRRQIPS